MENKPEKRSKFLSSLMTLLLFAMMIGLIWSSLKVDSSTANAEYYEIIQYFDTGKISEYSLNISSKKLTYVLEGETEKRTYTVPNVELFIADIHESVHEYNKANPDDPIKMDYEAGTTNSWLVELIPMVISILLMTGLMIFIFKRMSNTMLDDTKRTMAFGKVRLKSGEEGRKTTFEDVAGLDEEKEDLQEIVDFLKDAKKFNDLGARIPKGVLLVGPPGTGKTLLARAIAGEADATFLSISGSDFVEMYVGVGASRVRDLFDTAKKNTPAIVFIDEIDAVGRHRGAGMGGGHDEREQTLNQLLVEMDGFGENAGVIIIAATNRPDILDPALLRPGRFDRQITVNYPDVTGREAILKVHARNKPIGPDVSLNEIARATSGFTGADLENLLNEAALLAARKNKKALTKAEVEEATIKVVVGTEKKSKKINDEEKKLTAYHEAGHAVTNFYLETLDPVHQVSIIPRGMAGGYTMSLPKEDKSYVSKKQMLDELVSLLGGRVAEAIILGDISTGASNDIERATNIARNMIIKYGMSEKLGPITYGSNNDEVFLGRDYGHTRNYSEETAAEIDKEIENIIMHAYARCDEILRLHIDKLHELAQYLIENEKIDGAKFLALMNSDKETIPEEPVIPVIEEVVPEEPELPVVEETVPEEPELPTVEEMVPEEPELPAIEENLPEPEPEIVVPDEPLPSAFGFDPEEEVPDLEKTEEPLFTNFGSDDDTLDPAVMAVKSTEDSFAEFSEKFAEETEQAREEPDSVDEYASVEMDTDDLSSNISDYLGESKDIEELFVKSEPEEDPFDLDSAIDMLLNEKGLTPDEIFDKEIHPVEDETPEVRAKAPAKKAKVKKVSPKDKKDE